MTEIRILKEEDKIKDLGDKICRVVDYYEKRDFFTHDNEGQSLALAALADLMISIKEAFKSYDERFKKIEEHLKEKERMMVNK